jgi:PIN domain nuclease of toxin-antitoxin system
LPGRRLGALSDRLWSAVVRLPDAHRDPFDRLLIAQAITEPLVLLTNDEVLAGYPAAIRIV